MKNNLKKYLPKLNRKQIAFAYTLAIILIIAIVNSGLTADFRGLLKITIPNLDKAGHFLAMGLLAFLLNLAFHPKNEKRVRITSLLGSLLVLPLCTLEEFSQKHLTYRSFSYGDLAADYLGIMVFSLLFIYFIKSSKSNGLLIPKS